MKPEQQLIPLGHQNRPGHKLQDIRGICIHYTCNSHPAMNAAANVRWMGRNYIQQDGKLLEKDGKTKFRTGSAHVFCDMDHVIQGIPWDEVAWAVGDDTHIPWSDLNKGQQPVARIVFGNKQNYHTVSIEICNNDIIKNSDADWQGAVKNAMDVAADFCRSRKLKIDEAGSRDPQSLTVRPSGILLLRHYDLTGKDCPAPLVKDTAAWNDFISYVIKNS